MPQQNRAILKSYFESGDTPRAQEFQELIDSFLNKADDGITVEDNNNIGLGTATPQSKLDILGGLSIGQNYAGNEAAPLNGLLVEGSVGIANPNPQNKLDVAGGVSIGENYAGKQKAPENSLIIEGSAGIGTPIPNEKLTVEGAISLNEQEISPAANAGYGKIYVKSETIHSINFNGEDNYLDLSSHVDYFPKLDQGTISFWYRPEETPTSHQSLIYYGEKNSEHNYLEICIAPWEEEYQGVSLQFIVGDGEKILLHAYVDTTQLLFNEKRWYHIVVCCAPDHNKIYLDGIEQTLKYIYGKASTESFFFNSPIIQEEKVNQFILGNKWLNNLTYHTKGSIDEAAIISRPLHGEEIQEIYRNGRKFDLLQTFREGLEGYWRMGDVSTLPDVEDHSEKEYHGIIKGTIDETTLSKTVFKTLYFKDSLGKELPLSGRDDKGGLNSLWGQKGSDVYYNDGKVGIGTTRPYAKFDLYGDAKFRGSSNGSAVINEDLAAILVGPGSYRFIGANFYYPGIGFNHLLSHSEKWDDQLHAFIGLRLIDTPSSERSALVFATTTGVGLPHTQFPTEKLVIMPDGNVGIGTTNPGAKLHVQGIAAGASACGLLLTRIEGSPFMQWKDKDGKIAEIQFANSTLNIQNGSGGPLDKILLNGKVGIGTTNPLAPLVVKGQIIRKVFMATGNGNDATDNGQIVSRILSFTKLYHDTAIKITYCDNLRIYSQTTNSTARWEVRINGNHPPGGYIYQDKHNDVIVSGSNFHEPTIIKGYAQGLEAGEHRIEVWVKTPIYGHHAADCFTGWNNSTWSIEAEEVWI